MSNTDGGGFRVCRCGFKGIVTEASCPDCNADWLIPPMGAEDE